MKTIVITGSTRGIGFAMAISFLKASGRVVICGRKKDSVQIATKKLQDEFSNEQVGGIACDVGSYKDMQKLWDYAIEKFGTVDIWINNAGISNELKMLTEIPPEEMKKVVETNVLGEMYGSQVALKGFAKQGYGALYNMEGMGAKKGRMVDGLSIYGSTKAGLRFFNDAIAQENKNSKIVIGALLPGMVLTEMVTGQYEGKPEEWNKVERILRTISEDVDVVAEWMVERMLANRKNGARFSYSNSFRIMGKMIKMMFK